MMDIITAATMCLALNVYHEARGEPLNGQIAVARVTMRRADHKAERVCPEVFRPKQFSWTNTLAYKVKGGYKLKKEGHPKEMKAWATSWRVARAVLIDDLIPAVAPKATHFHRIDIEPYWAKTLVKVKVIGNHVFYREPYAHERKL